MSGPPDMRSGATLAASRAGDLVSDFFGFKSRSQKFQHSATEAASGMKTWGNSRWRDLNFPDPQPRLRVDRDARRAAEDWLKGACF